MPGVNKKSKDASKALYNKAYEQQHPLKDMFKETDPDKVQDFIAQADFIAGDPKALFDLSMQEESCINQKERECMIDEGNIKIIDFQLDARGPMEDQFYGLDPLLVKNVRRGNTILEVKTGDGQTLKYLMGRKGLPKFFDMRVEFIDKATRRDMQ